MMQAVGYKLGSVVIYIVGGATIPRCEVNPASPQRQCYRLHGHRHAFLPKQQGVGQEEAGGATFSLTACSHVANTKGC